MGVFNGGLGRSGETLFAGVYSMAIQLPENEYPVKIEFHTKPGGAYWKNHTTDKTGTISLAGDADGKTAIALDTFTMGTGKKTGTSRSWSPPYDVDGSSLIGCPMYLVIDAPEGWGLRNYCAVTITTEVGNLDNTPAPTMSPDVYQKLLPSVDQNDKLIGLARRSAWAVSVEGVDVTDVIEKDLIALDVTDNEEDAADDLQIRIADRDGVWLQKWLNETVQQGSKTKGLTFTVWIGTQTSDGKIAQQKTGTFFLDSMRHKGPPALVTIKCTSCDYAGGIRSEDHDKSWENYSLWGIAEEIGNKGGLRTLYCSPNNPYFDRKEQASETDIAFLIRICSEAGLSVKITDHLLVIFERSQFENEASIQTITYGDGSYLNWSLDTSSRDKTYDFCTVKYTDPATGYCIIGSYYTPEWQKEEDRVAKANAKAADSKQTTPKHQELVITNKRVTDINQANEMAKSELTLKNRFERTVDLTFPGNPAIMAGLPISLKGFGYWSGKYMIATATHTISDKGYTTKVKLRFVRKEDEQ